MQRIGRIAKCSHRHVVDVPSSAWYYCYCAAMHYSCRTTTTTTTTDTSSATTASTIIAAAELPIATEVVSDAAPTEISLPSSRSAMAAPHSFRNSGRSAASSAPTRGGRAAAAMPGSLVFVRRITDLRIFHSMEPLKVRHAVVDYLRFQHFEHHQQTTRGRRKQAEFSLNQRHFPLSPLQVEALASAFLVVVENKSLPLASVSSVLKYRWHDPIFLRHKRYITSHILSRVVEEIHAAKASTSSGAPPLPSQTPTPALTSVAARRILINISNALESFGVNSVPLVGSLATIGLQDVDTIDDPNVLIELMWAVRASRTNAPNSFWDTTLRRLFKLHRSANVAKHDAIINTTQLTEGECAVINNGATTRAVVGESTQQQHPQSSKLQRVSGVVGGALSVRQIYRILRVLHVQNVTVDLPFQRLLVESSLRQIGDVTATKKFFPSAHKKLTRLQAERRIFVCTGLLSKELLSLLSLAGTLGVQYATFATRFARELLYPLVVHASFETLQMLLDSMGATQCHNPEMLQVVIDGLVRRCCLPPNANGQQATNEVQLRLQSPRMSSLSLVCAKRVCRIVSSENGLGEKLQLGSYSMMLHELAAANCATLRPGEMLQLMDEMYILSRCFSKDSRFVGKLREIAEAFAGVFRRHLDAGVLRLSLVNKFLELTVILGMRSKGVANGKGAAFPNVVSLLQLRNQVHEFFVSQNTAGVAACAANEEEADVGIASRFLVDADGYSASTALVRCFGILSVKHQLLLVYGKKSTEANLPEFIDILAKTKVVAVLQSSVTFRDLYFGGSTKNCANSFPFVLHRAICFAVLRSIRLANLSEQSSVEDVKCVLGVWPPSVLLHSTNMIREKRQVVSPSPLSPSSTSGAASTSPNEMADLWALLKKSPLVVLKKHKELWVFVRLVAKKLGSESDVALAERLMAIAMQ